MDEAGPSGKGDSKHVHVLLIERGMTGEISSHILRTTRWNTRYAVHDEGKMMLEDTVHRVCYSTHVVGFVLILVFDKTRGRPNQPQDEDQMTKQPKQSADG